AGVLVDRFGARRILSAGLAILGTAIALAGMAPRYGALVLAMVGAGLGNGVFHPADYSIFNTRVDPRRLGRAYSAHSSSGSLGWGMAPIAVGGLATVIGWGVAVASGGRVGVLVALAGSRGPEPGAGDLDAGYRGLRNLDDRDPDEERRRPAVRAPRHASDLAAAIRPLLRTPILMAFAYFALIAASMSAVQAFAV